MFLSQFFKNAAPAINKKQMITTMKRTTGYSLSQCKNALDENDYDLDSANKWLAQQAKKEGWSKMQKLSARRAKDGYCVIAEDSNWLTMFELNCETDFVAKTPAFKELVTKLGENFLSDGKNDVEKNTEEIASAIYVIRENILLNKVKIIQKTEKDVGKYVHNPVEFNPHISGGRFTAVCVGSNGDSPKTLSSLAQQVMACSPTKVGKINLQEFELLRTDDELSDLEALQDSLAVIKPELSVEDISKMNANELKKHFRKIKPDETRLLYQEYLTKGRFCVGKYLTDSNARVDNFYRYQLGED